MDVGRMGENIVTNELLAQNFLVTHLDKGTRGVSANADLMCARPDAQRPILIQCKACYVEKLDWIFFGSITRDMIDGKATLYNAKNGFHAEFLAAVVLRSPREYRWFVFPIKVAEEIALTAARAWDQVPTREGKQRSTVPKFYLPIDASASFARASGASKTYRVRAREQILPYEGAFGLLR